MHDDQLVTEQNENLLRFIAATVDTMRDQMVTKAELADVKEQMATKAELAIVKDNIARLERTMATKAELAALKEQIATKIETAAIRGDIEPVQLRLDFDRSRPIWKNGSSRN